MTSRAGLRALARAELNDTAVPQVWTDLQLNQWLLEAIRRYSEDFARETSQTIASVANQADYALASDCLRVAQVEHPSGLFRVPDPLSAGDVDATTDLPQAGPATTGVQLAYEVWGSFGSRSLTLRPAPANAADSIVVRYLATWAEPVSDSSVLATPARDDQLLVWLICRSALNWLGTDESKRQRYERDRGASVNGQAAEYWARYRGELALRGASASGRRRLVVRQ